MPSPPFPGLRPHRQGCQDDRPSRQSLYVTGRHPGAGIPPHVLQMGALGQAPAGRGRACGGHCCRQVWGRGLQGATLVHPSLLLPQEGPRHGQMVLLGGVPWASTQPAPTAASADPAAPCLRPPAPPLSCPFLNSPSSAGASMLTDHAAMPPPFTFGPWLILVFTLGLHVLWVWINV